MSRKDQSKLGVHLLDTITQGMYREPLDCIREYIQNAYDSIRAARRNGCLKEDEGEVHVMVDRENETVLITDNGHGLAPDEAVTCLLDLGASDKAATQDRAKENAGFRGIGRMAGITYCNALQFSTSRGGNIKTVVRFDAKRLREWTRPGQPPRSIDEAVNENVEVEAKPNKEGKRYFEVRLEGVNHQGFLKHEELNRYLGQVAPVAFDPRRWKFGEKILEIARKRNFQASLDCIAIKIVDPDGSILHDVRRFHKGTLDNGSKITGVEPLPLGGESITTWWGWLAVHPRLGQLTKGDDAIISGLRLRMHNIQIGDHQTYDHFFKGSDLRFNRWCVGEIHIVGHGIVPNARRDNFEDTSEWRNVREQLKDNAKKIGDPIRKESTHRNQDPATIFQTIDLALDAVKHTQAGSPSRSHHHVATLSRLGKKLGKLGEKPKVARVHADQIAEYEKRIERAKEDLQGVSKETRQVVEVRMACVDAGQGAEDQERIEKAKDDLQGVSKEYRRVVVEVIEKVLKANLKKEDFDDIQTKIYEALQLEIRK